MGRRRTRKQWYEYHLFRAQEAERALVEARYVAPIQHALQQLKVVEDGLRKRKESLPLWDRLLASFGTHTERHRVACHRWEEALVEWKDYLNDLRDARYTDLVQADAQGEANYQAVRSQRQQETAARAERVVQRKHERRVRYLEQSPALRSAARFFRRLLLRLHARDGESVECFYCGVVVHKTSAHLEHKRPISRGGDNRRSNLVMACAACNLAKGRKTHEEFIRSRQGNAL